MVGNGELMSLSEQMRGILMQAGYASHLRELALAARSARTRSAEGAGRASVLAALSERRAPTRKPGGAPLRRRAVGAPPALLVLGDF